MSASDQCVYRFNKNRHKRKRTQSADDCFSYSLTFEFLKRLVIVR